MVEITNILVNAMTISALYALVAAGFTLIFGVGGVLNLSHGGLITLGAFSGYIVSTVWELDAVFGLLAATITCGVVGAAIYLGIVKRLNNPIIILIVTLIAGFFIEHSLRIFVTNGSIFVPSIVPSSYSFASVEVQANMLLIFFLAWGLIVSLFIFVTRTESGKAIIAVNQSKKGAALVGIKEDRINLYTWSLAAMFAGIAGFFLASFRTGSWNMGIEPLLLSFSIVILGGLGSIKGSIVGAYVIGSLETFTTSLISPRLTGVSALLVLVVMLLARPSGLFGREATTDTTAVGRTP